MQGDGRLVRLSIAVSVVFVWLASSTPLQAENWPNWRGPRYSGVSLEKNIPAEWSRSKNVAWKLELPGPAGATPVVWENRLFLTAVDGDNLILMGVGTGAVEPLGLGIARTVVVGGADGERLEDDDLAM